MKIIEVNLNLGSLSYNNRPDKIVLHHAEASNCSVQDINSWHKANGWAGIGYHYYVRKDGSIYRGRPESAQGAHCPGANDSSIGICAEGKYDIETMPLAQKNVIVELCKDIVKRYGIKKIYRHKDLYSTDCPGSKYPFNEIVNLVFSTTPIEPPEPNYNNLIQYQAHVQSIGWGKKKYGGEISGTVGQAKRLEALTIKWEGNGTIKFEGHVQSIGWTGPRISGEVIGTIDEALRLEAVKIWLEGSDRKLKYRVHIQTKGWTPWLSEKEIAGTTGQRLRIEAVQIKVE